jgi:cytoskeletal protein RodZ
MNLTKLRDKRIPRFRIHFRPMETAIILAVVLLGTSGILYQKHEQKIHQQLNIAPASSQSSQDAQPSSTLNASTSTQPAQTTTPSTTTSPQSSSDSTTSDCTVKTLPPPPTTYEDTNALPQGQTEQASTGSNGSEAICNGNPITVLQGLAPVVWVGTGTSSGSSTTEQPQANTNQGSEQEYEDCMQSVQSQAEVDNGLSPDEEQEAQEACSQYL